jgi:hypothetical protein
MKFFLITFLLLIGLKANAKELKLSESLSLVLTEKMDSTLERVLTDKLTLYVRDKNSKAVVVHQSEILSFPIVDIKKMGVCSLLGPGFKDVRWEKKTKACFSESEQGSQWVLAEPASLKVKNVFRMHFFTASYNSKQFMNSVLITLKEKKEHD